MPLNGFKVLEFVSQAPVPGPFCSKILSDFGAAVTRVDRITHNPVDVFKHGKRTIAVNLKKPAGQALVRRLAGSYDVVIDPFRPQVMERLNLGPKLLCKDNPRLIYARLTGFGQSGRLAPRAGHDLNYLAISGVLSMLGRRHEKPTAPINLLADFAGGSLMCAFGICAALLERHRTGRGQVVDAAMCDGVAYIASWLFMSRGLGFWGKERGANILDGGAYFYDTYETKDGQYMSVAAIEPQFFEQLKAALHLPMELTQFGEDNERGRELLSNIFRTKSQAEWSAEFENIDACVYPVVPWQNVRQHDHNSTRDSFKTAVVGVGDEMVLMPTPAPRLSRTPGRARTAEDQPNFDNSIIEELSLSSDEIMSLVDEGVLQLPKQEAKL